jgi:integrase
MVAFFRWLIDDQKRSAKTIHDYRYMLAGLFEWLIRQTVFISNPVHDLPECTRVTYLAPVPIHQFDIMTFREALQHDPQLWLACQFQYYCALRPGRELRLLRIRDIDFSRGQVTVPRTQAKTKVTRTVVIPQQFLSSLRNDFHLTAVPKDHFVFGKNGEPGPDHLGKNNLRFRFNDVRKALGMPINYKFYSWKHTGGVQASLSGIPDSHIQRQMGHTSIETTAKYLRKMTGFQSDFLRNQYPSI